MTNTTTWAASLAFYTSLSLAPLLILFVTFSAQLSPDLQQSFLAETHNLVGPQAATSIEMVIENAKARSDLRSLSGLLGILTLLLSASFVFGELRAALNQIFEIKMTKKNPAYDHLLKSFVKDYILQMGLAFAFLFIMIVSLIASTALSAFLYAQNETFSSVINIAGSTAFFMGLFTLLFHVMPSQRLTWQRSWQAGLTTGLLFVGGKEIIGLYLGQSAMSTSYGAAGSLVILLAWVYYSAMIIFIGAHATTTLSILSKKKSEELHQSDQFVPLMETHEV